MKVLANSSPDILVPFGKLDVLTNTKPAPSGDLRPRAVLLSFTTNLMGT